MINSKENDEIALLVNRGVDPSDIYDLGEIKTNNQGLSQDLGTGCPKLAIVKCWGV